MNPNPATSDFLLVKMATKNSHHPEPYASRNHFREEPQPLSPARSKVAFRNTSGADVSIISGDSKTALTQPKPYIDLSTSGHDFMVNPSPKHKKKSRPQHFYESPRVHVKTVFMKFGEVDTVKEKFDADLFLQARWREPALDSHHPKKAEVNWAELWNPGIHIHNLLATRFDKTWRQTEFTSTGEAFVVEKRRVKGTFAESMELQDFPFDTQHLSVIIIAEDSEVELVEDAREPSLVSHLIFVDEQEFLIRDLVECVPGNQDTTDLGSVMPGGAMLIVRVHATRRGGFFFWNVLVIMCLICSLIFCTFSVSREHPTNRLQLSFTVVLTTVAFKFVTNQHLPKVPYLTILDKYILSSMVLMHLMCVWHSVICLVANNSLTDALDIIAFFVFLFEFLLVQLIFAVYVRHRIRGKRIILQQLENQYKEKLNRLLGAGYTDRADEERKKRTRQKRFLPDATVGAI
ncbi:hypothetical protein EGW08_014964 [Elysia chlorotica]|uniref:Neurotransmitter-gated ion-channel ligand-binding domain-containing protein n=1 Tax=Elysia chlorotica TaxID=188477 RepID=A0A3S1BXA1_ELYCH|nr:hypothetical protein EGW08_014964 [Elysia chlorotica]